MSSLLETPTNQPVVESPVNAIARVSGAPLIPQVDGPRRSRDRVRQAVNRFTRSMRTPKVRPGETGPSVSDLEGNESPVDSSWLVFASIICGGLYVISTFLPDAFALGFEKASQTGTNWLIQSGLAVLVGVISVTAVGSACKLRLGSFGSTVCRMLTVEMVLQLAILGMSYIVEGWFGSVLVAPLAVALGWGLFRFTLPQLGVVLLINLGGRAAIAVLLMGAFNS